MSAKPEHDAARKGITHWLGDLPSRALALIAGLILFAMMLLTLFDVAGRYLFNSPLPATSELIALMIAGLVFCALPYVCFREMHVTIDILDDVVPDWLKRIQGMFVNVFSAVALLVIAWRLYEMSITHYRYEEVSDELLMPFWPFTAAMAFLGVVAAWAQICAAAQYATGARSTPAQSYHGGE